MANLGDARDRLPKVRVVGPDRLTSDVYRGISSRV